MHTSITQEQRSYITVGQENSTPIELYYEDHGSGKPVVLIHGWPAERGILGEAGRGAARGRVPRHHLRPPRVRPVEPAVHRLRLRHLRRGPKQAADHARPARRRAGRASRWAAARWPATSARYGSERVRQAVFISSVPPFLLKTADNPAGVDGTVFDGIKQAIAADRLAFLSEFLKNFYNVDLLGGKLISEQVVQQSWNVAAAPRPWARSTACGLVHRLPRRPSDRRPALVIHGDADRIVPIAASGELTAKAVKGARKVVIQGGPHGLTWTHADQVNKELLAFLK